MEINNFEASKDEKTIRTKIVEAILSAPNIREAKRWTNGFNKGRSIKGTPGVCVFDDPEEYRLANTIINSMLSGAHFISYADNVDHEIEHFQKAKELGCETSLGFIFGIDDRKIDRGTNHLSWSNLWNKAFTFFVKPNGVSDEEWQSTKRKIYEAASSMSKGDKRAVRNL